MEPNGSAPVYRSLTVRRTKQQGFTLIELLIVFGIIAVLAGILFPVFVLARSHVRKTVCVSNMHQCYLAVAQYTQDYDETFPTYRPFPDDTPPFSVRFDREIFTHYGYCQGTLTQNSRKTQVWTDLIISYIKKASVNAANPPVPAEDALDGLQLSHLSSKLFFCPEDRNREKRSRTSYEFKYWLSENKSIGAITSPSRMAVFWEQQDYHQGGENNEYSRDAAGNITLTDGHVKWIRYSQTTSALYGNTDEDINNPDMHDSYHNDDRPEDDGADIP